MRSRLITGIAVATMLVPSVIHAQGVTLGLRGGYSVTDQNRSTTTEGQSGLLGGVFVGIHLSPVWAIQPEVLLAGRGAEIEDAAGSFGIEQTYLDVPVLVKATLPIISPAFRPVLYAGPVLSFELNCEGESEIGDVDDMNDTEDADADDSSDSDDVACNDASLGAAQLATKSTEFGALFGAGLDISLGRFVLGLDARYQLGLTNISDGGTESIKNRMFSVMASVGIRVPPLSPAGSP